MSTVNRGCLFPSLTLLAIPVLALSACAGLSGEVCLDTGVITEQEQTQCEPKEEEIVTGLELF